MTTRANLAGLVTRLMGHVTSPAEISCADEVVAVVLSACRTDGFAHVPSFKWLVSVLLALGEQPSAHSDAVADLLMEVVLRVPSVRAHATSAVFSAALDNGVIIRKLSQRRHTLAEVFRSAMDELPAGPGAQEDRRVGS